ncbi:MAG: hypothetical protein GY925_12910 [Actinomycetia bacterium]|nr:hypothetical protein [Actinomycetes bacterium]
MSWSKSDNIASVPAREASDLVDSVVFTTEWRTVDQEHLDQFHWSVEMTADQVDLSLSAAFPDGSRNVDGFMLMSLVQSAFFSNCPIYAPGSFAFNYGVDGMRFPSTVYLGDRLRLIATVTDWADKQGGVLITFGLTMEHENHDKPAMVAEFKTFFVDADAVS